MVALCHLKINRRSGRAEGGSTSYIGRDDRPIFSGVEIMCLVLFCTEKAVEFLKVLRVKKLKGFETSMFQTATTIV